MKNNLFMSAFLVSIKYGFFATIFTVLFAAIPINIAYYIYNLKSSYESSYPINVSLLPLEWLGAALFVLTIIYTIPFLVATNLVNFFIWIHKKNISKKSIGKLTGALIGALATYIGTFLFLQVTEDTVLNNWIFMVTLILFGSSVFSWTGHKIEAVYSLGESL